jgi:hypothetical protein
MTRLGECDDEQSGQASDYAADQAHRLCLERGTMRMRSETRTHGHSLGEPGLEGGQGLGSRGTHAYSWVLERRAQTRKCTSKRHLSEEWAADTCLSTSIAIGPRMADPQASFTRLRTCASKQWSA